MISVPYQFCDGLSACKFSGNDDISSLICLRLPRCNACRLTLSMTPNATDVTSIDVPPLDINGRGWPETGNAPRDYGHMENGLEPDIYGHPYHKQCRVYKVAPIGKCGRTCHQPKVEQHHKQSPNKTAFLNYDGINIVTESQGET